MTRPTANGIGVLVAGFGMTSLLAIALWQWTPILLWQLPQSAAGIAAHIFLLTDGWWSVALVATTAVLLALRRGPDPGPLRRHPDLALAATIVATAALIALGAIASQGHPWSADEYCALWQSEVFASGSWHGRYPEAWRDAAPAAGVFIHRMRDVPDGVITGYLPSFALLLTPFTMAGAPWLLNPLLTALGAVVLDRLVIRLGADTPGSRAVALAFYATSSQVIVGAGTLYAMPAHLTGNLLWLLLFMRAQDGCRPSLVLLPLLGGFLLLLHKPFHAIFLLPFALRILRTWNWRWWFWMAVPYLAAWMAMRTWNGLWAASSYEAAITSIMSRGWHLESILGVVQVWSWQPIVALLACGSLHRWHTYPPVIRDVAAGCLLAVVLIAVRQDGQGHGWGARYFHPLLGGLTVWGWWVWRYPVAGSTGPHPWWLAGALAVSGMACLARVAIVAHTIAPYRIAETAMRSLDADIILLRPSEYWLAHDLRHNDPWLSRRPVILHAGALPPGFRLPSAKILEFGNRELEATGMRHINDLPRAP